MKVVKNNNRIFYFDILRVIACLAVIMIHSSASFVQKDFSSFNFFVGNVFNSIARIGVPLFVMISGALLLDEKYEFTKEKLKTHIKKMIIFFIFWSIIYCLTFSVIMPLVLNNGLNLKSIIYSLVKGYYHLWFVYMIIGLYLIIPILRLIVKKENKKYIEYFLLLSFIFTFLLPQIANIGSHYKGIFNLMNTILNTINLRFVGGYTTYFILGWYLHNFDIKHKTKFYILGIVGLLISIIGTFILSYTTNSQIDVYDNLNINILFQAIMVFIFIKTKFFNITSINNITKSISKYSLGIYAVHALILKFLYDLLLYYKIDFALIHIPLLFSLTFIFSLLVSSIISKIPILKKTI